MRRAVSRLFDNGTHVSSSSICVTLSYIPYLPFTKWAALRCTISNLSELYFWWGCQTVALYSRKERTVSVSETVCYRTFFISFDLTLFSKINTWTCMSHVQQITMSHIIMPRIAQESSKYIINQCMMN